MPVRATIETAAWLILAAALALGIGDIFHGHWDHDCGMFLLHASYIAEGMRPYLDYSSIYPPLMEFLTAIPIKLQIDRLALVVAAPAFWIIANAAASFFVVYAATRNRLAGVIVAAMFPLFSIQNGGNHLTLEHGVAFFALLAFGFALQSRWALAGLCVAGATLMKQPGVIAALPVVAIAFTREPKPSRRDAGAFVAGAAAIPLVLLIWLRFRLLAIYHNIVRDLGTYAQAKRVPGWTNEFHRAPETVWLFAIVALVGIALIATTPRLRLIAAAALAGALIEFVPRMLRDYPHYNINMWPFLVLVLALGVERWPVEVAAPLAIFVPLVTFFTYVNGLTLPSPLLDTFEPAARIVASVTPPRGVVRQYGAEPIIEYLANRHQEQIDWGTRAFADWEGVPLYTTPPVKGSTVVVVDRHEPWVKPVMGAVLARGFHEVGAVGTGPRVTIFR